MVRDERGVSQGRTCRDDFRAADPYSGIAFFDHVNAGFGAFMNRPVAVDGRMNDRVVEIQHSFLRLLVPGFRVGLIGRIEGRVRSQRPKKRCLVIG